MNSDAPIGMNGLGLMGMALKDAELIMEQARRHGLHLPITAVQTDLLRAAIALKGPDSDSSAVTEALRRPATNEVAP
jgi:3-hydroxyisobutyrate dehydrogenase-like beta-hydroxyacid dehydrogenase